MFFGENAKLYFLVPKWVHLAIRCKEKGTWRRRTQNYGIYQTIEISTWLGPKCKTLSLRTRCRFNYAFADDPRTSFFSSKRRRSYKVYSIWFLWPFRTKKVASANDFSSTRFHLLHLGLVREYFDLEFHSEKLPFQFDLGMQFYFPNFWMRNRKSYRRFCTYVLLRRKWFSSESSISRYCWWSFKQHVW